MLLRTAYAVPENDIWNSKQITIAHSKPKLFYTKLFMLHLLNDSGYCLAGNAAITCAMIPRQFQA